MRACVALAVLAVLLGCGDAPAPSSSVGTGSAAPLAIPRPASAKVLSQKAPDDRYTLETWCLDRDAEAAITTALAADGWSAIRTAGTPRSIAATRGDLRFSAKASRNAERCAGTYLTATVMRLGR